MQKLIFSITLFLPVVLMLLFASRDGIKVAQHEELGLYAGNMGIGGSPPGPAPTPTATASATPTPTPIPTPPPDTEAPIVNVTNPESGSQVSGLVQVTAEALDNGGIASVGFYVDNNSIGTDYSAPYSTLWDTTVYPQNSVHSITATASDLAGNQALSSAVLVTVLDITSPSVAITNPINGSVVRKNSTVTITADTSDVSGIDKVEFYVDGVLKCTDTSPDYFCNWKVSPRKNVLYSLGAKAYDIAGNTSTSVISVTSK